MGAFYAQKARPFHRRVPTPGAHVNRVKCSNCRSYFDRNEQVWSNNLQRICSTACLSEYMDRSKPTKNEIRAKHVKKTLASRPKASLPLEVRLEVRRRDSHCRWCGRKGQEVHHIHYRSEGGSDETSNLLLLCTTCHGRAHESKVAFKPLLLAYVWVYYVEGRSLSIPEVARYLDSLGLLTDVSRGRLEEYGTVLLAG